MRKGPQSRAICGAATTLEPACLSQNGAGNEMFDQCNPDECLYRASHPPLGGRNARSKKGSWREGCAICGAATTLEPACYNVPCIMRGMYFKQMRASTRIGSGTTGMHPCKPGQCMRVVVVESGELLSQKRLRVFSPTQGFLKTSRIGRVKHTDPGEYASFSRPLQAGSWRIRKLCSASLQYCHMPSIKSFDVSTQA